MRKLKQETKMNFNRHIPLSLNFVLPACDASCVDSSNSFFYEGAEHVFVFSN